MTEIFSDETAYRQRIVTLLGEYDVTAQSHEDKFSKYVPDLSWSGKGNDGWVEVKYTDRPPPSLSAIHHWTIGQQNWLINAGKKGSGHCYLWLGTRTGEHFIWAWHILTHVRSMDLARAGTVTAARGSDLRRLVRDFSHLIERDGPTRVTVL